ncbi:ABC transporter ATP-binding protein [Halocatena salina]|uniref:ABC transporter ATP-binding protein n=1 Tax=Halocatena salina TaxID=2934340 RepID=A0A8U0A2K7_9EURY|nr:ABC transporter ATP-binding protein [Halocatena salina]UPM42243.1 ABC transporter ATP-binding protein [Halocatena salina]
MSSPNAIDAEALTKQYGSTRAVDALDLSIPPGTVYGFLGPNGAGKTTTIRMLVTLLQPTGGTAAIDGQPITDRDRVVSRLGYLPESPPLYEELTGREQLEYIAGLRDMSDDHATERIDELLELFSLTSDANKRINTYSKGMKQKTGIIQAILHDPPVVFLDEPTSGLDPRAARTVRDTIADLAAGETTVFLSTHILPVVDEIADTVGVLYDGDLVAEGPPENLKQRVGSGGSLEDAFLAVTDGDDLVGGR